MGLGAKSHADDPFYIMYLPLKQWETQLLCNSVQIKTFRSFSLLPWFIIIKSGFETFQYTDVWFNNNQRNICMLNRDKGF